MQDGALVQKDILVVKDFLADYLKTFKHRGGIIIWPEQKVLYMKPSRAAGTSIRRSIAEQLPGRIHNKKNPGETRRWLMDITDKDLKDYFIFTVCRNPWDRMVSIATTFKIPFEKFIRHDIQRWEFPNEDVREHAWPCSMYAYKNGVRFADYVVRFEHLQDDYNELCRKIGIKSVELPRLVPSKHDHYREYYDKEMGDIVADVYSDDIENFNYTF